jgi:arginine/serine-rich splicing factor 4/5/6
MGTRVFIGRLPSRATERDIEHFFRGNGRIREVVLKTGFAFVVRLHTQLLLKADFTLQI